MPKSLKTDMPPTTLVGKICSAWSSKLELCFTAFQALNKYENWQNKSYNLKEHNDFQEYGVVAVYFAAKYLNESYF